MMAPRVILKAWDPKVRIATLAVDVVPTPVRVNVPLGFDTEDRIVSFLLAAGKNIADKQKAQEDTPTLELFIGTVLVEPQQSK